MNSNRGISFDSLRVDLKAYLQENVSKYFWYRSTIIRSVPKAEERTTVRRAEKFSEMNEDGYGDGSIKIRAFPRLAFSTSRRRYHVAGSALWLSSCISCQFNFRGKNKAPLVASFSRHRLAAFALGDSRERVSEPWGISNRHDRSHKVKRRC